MNARDRHRLLRLLPYLARDRRRLLLTVVLLLPVAFSAAVQPLLVGQAITVLRHEPTASWLEGMPVPQALRLLVILLLAAVLVRLSLQGLRVAIDCANGAGYRVAPTTLYELGAEVCAVGVEPNGLNINADCGSTHPETLAEAVKRYRADIGIALDGDADRLIVCDERGQVIDGDQILNPGGLRMEREFVKHKALDAIGDLYVLGAPLLGRYEGVKAGHAINNLLVRELLANPQAWREVTRVPDMAMAG